MGEVLRNYGVLPDKALLDHITACLDKGGVIVLPTETVYGLMCLPDKAEAIDKMYALKGRDRSKPLQQLADSTEVIESSGFVFSETEAALASLFWPGPMTLVMEKPDSGETTGFRIPAHRFLRHILSHCGGLITATSANRSSELSPSTFAALDKGVLEEADLCVDNGPASGGIESTVLEVREGSVKIVRKGALALEVIQKKLIAKQKDFNTDSLLC